MYSRWRTWSHQARPIGWQQLPKVAGASGRALPQTAGLVLIVLGLAHCSSSSGAPPQPPLQVRTQSANQTFFDDFDALSFDSWPLITPSSTFGRGGPNMVEEGDQWWTNPFTPETSIDVGALYSTSNGQLHLGLLPTPPEMAAYIRSNAGTDLPYLGTLLNSTPSNNQLFGYREVRVAVDNLPGFAFQACLESWETAGTWPPEIDMRINTDADGVQQIHFQVDGVGSDPWSAAIDATQMHTYGVDWESDNITFYIDRNQVFQVATPQGSYTTNAAYWYLLTAANYIDPNRTDPDPSARPHAHVDYVGAWDGLPF